ncbi:MAG: AmmeMemoRadiSam system radical SAM enzyme [Treponema sp.]|nr:AmmeMemoRadiSam system radical SAM enzyme [Treponema sp.]
MLPVRYISGNETEGRVRCSLCPHTCLIQNGKTGICGVRGNKGGCGIIPFSSRITAIAMDPIEKKPLYHWRPGSEIFSVGFSGCNMHCPFCQNWRISQNPGAPGRDINPADIISLALHEMPDNPAIAYTYSEPLIHTEYLLECMPLARRYGIANVLVTNGCINSAPAREILALTDAANIDLKCFTQDSYSKILGGDLDTVLNFIKLAYSMGVHIEITTLVVPEFNDTEKELDSIAHFIADIDANIPWHVSAYHPDYRWNAPPTNPEFLLSVAQRGRKILKHVYTGNIGNLT